MEFYEYSRDLHRHPICWQSENPDCYPHFHKSIELVYVLQGSLSAVLNGSTHQVSQGQILIVPGYTIHSFKMTGGTRTWVCTIPQEVIAAFKTVLSSYTFARAVVDAGDGGMEEQGHILWCFKEIYQCLEEGSAIAGHAHMMGCAYLILGWIMEHAGLVPAVRGKNGSFAREVLEYLEDHYLECCDLEEISGHFGYSSEHRGGNYFLQDHGPETEAVKSVHFSAKIADRAGLRDGPSVSLS